MDGQHRAFRVLTAFAIIAQCSADQTNARITLVDVSPNLGAINRTAIGPTLKTWRQWSDRLNRFPSGLDLDDAVRLGITTCCTPARL